MLAILHFVFFKVFNGQDVAAAPADFQQSHVSAISLLFVTGFRAAITSVLGIGLTQYLWHILRTETLRIGLIEDLFQIRSNVLSLLNPKVIQRTPLLFLVVLFSWLLPLATIYPPGALTVQTEAH
jgi:hypothetical protein